MYLLGYPLFLPEQDTQRNAYVSPTHKNVILYHSYVLLVIDVLVY